MRAGRALCIAALCAGCFGIAKQARDVRAGLLGVPASRITRCLGPPLYHDATLGREIWAYVLRLPHKQMDVDITLAEGLGTAHKRPEVSEGRPASTTATDTRNLDPVGHVDPGSCRLVFEMREGHVLALDARGRTRTNMNADAECAILAQHCVPLPEPEGGGA